MKKKWYALGLAVCIFLNLFSAFPITAIAATSGTCGSNLRWTLNSGTLTISGTGNMDDYHTDTPPWRGSSAKIKKVVLEEGTYKIGHSAFAGCVNLSSVSLPESLSVIGNRAFEGCSRLTSLTLPQNLKKIGDYTFMDCESLENIYVDSENVYFCSVNGNLFSRDMCILVRFCPAKTITTYSLLPSVTVIGPLAFDGCKNLTNISRLQNVESIEHRAFRNCTGLRSLALPAALTTISTGTFSYCENLTSVLIPSGVTTIEDYAFTHCRNLRIVTIPNSVKKIGAKGFDICNNLDTVRYTGTSEEWNAIQIYEGNAALSMANVVCEGNRSRLAHLFSGSAYTYNHELAQLSFEFAEAAFSAEELYTDTGTEAAKKRAKDILEKYREYRFTRVTYINYGKALTRTDNTAAYSVASQDIDVNGERKRLVAVVFRGGGYGGEWASNFNVGSSSISSHGFALPAAIAVERLKREFAEYASQDVILWITGYSRGGAIANLVAGQMGDYADSCSNLSREDIYTYTFATPKPINYKNTNVSHEKYDNIFNIIHPCDYVPNVLPADWGYGRYGITKTFYTTPTKAVKDTYKKLTGNTYTINAAQKDIVSEMMALLTCIASTKEEFYRIYQGIAQDFIYWVMVYKEMRSDASLLDYAISKYGSAKVANCYLAASADVDFYVRRLRNLGFSDKIFTYLKQFGTICELNNQSVDVILDDVLSDVAGYTPTILAKALSIIFDVSDMNKDWSGFITVHQKPNYEAWLFSSDSPKNIFIEDLKSSTESVLTEYNNKYKKLSINCPVDVTVTDKDGNVVVSVVNHEILIDELPVVVTDDKIKIFYYDNFDDYNIEIKPYADGIVNYYVSEYAAGTEETKRVAYENIRVTVGDTLTGSLNDEINTDVSNYDLTLSKDEGTSDVNSSEILTEADLENICANVEVIGSGAATSRTAISKGDYVTLEAKAFTGAKFLGWYENDICISENTVYSYVAENTRNFVAKFTTVVAQLSETVAPQTDGTDLFSSVAVTANASTNGYLEYTAYSGETAVVRHTCPVTLNSGESRTYMLSVNDSEEIETVTVRLLGENDEEITESITSNVIREPKEYESGIYKYTFYTSNTIMLTAITDTNASTLIIPSQIDGYNVVSFGNNLFENMSFESISIPETLIQVKAAAFAGCKNLSRVYYRGDTSQYSQIEVETTDNKSFSNAKVIYGHMDVSATFSNCVYDNGAVSADVNLNCILQDCLVSVGVFNTQGKLLALQSAEAFVGDERKKFSFPNVEVADSYIIKAMFWDEGQLKILGDTITTTLTL